MREGTIKSRLSRARALLKESLTENEICSRTKEEASTKLQLR